jgi:hypothetical protein
MPNTDVISSVENEYIKLLKPAPMDASSRPECLSGTRGDVLKSVTDWVTTPSKDRNVLWLHGLAGSGKSTISTTIAEYFREINRLAAFIFFDRNDPKSSRPSTVIHTLAYKLAHYNPAIQTAISESIERNSGVTEAPLRVQFAKLLLEPLTTLLRLHEQGPVVIIFDALDECGDHVSRMELLALLAQELAKFPPFFRFVIASRREPDIEGAFSHCDNIVAKELDITDHSNDEDISSYIRHHMAHLRKNDMFQLSSVWPGEEKIQALTRSSAGLFIWASTAVKFIAEGHHPNQQLGILLQPHPREVESALDVLYGTALRGAGKWDNDEVAADFRAVLGVIIVARMPLSDVIIDKILDLDGHRSSRFILSRLRCLLQWTPGQPVLISHASFADYLADARRCGTHQWFIDVFTHHRSLALACFRIMKAGLRFNICELETSHIFNDDVRDLRDRISRHIPASLSYACCYWAGHLQETVAGPDLVASLDDFFQFQFLYWLEVSSLTQGIDIALHALLSAVSWAKVGLYVVDPSMVMQNFSFRATTKSLQHSLWTLTPLSQHSEIPYRRAPLIFIYRLCRSHLRTR